ncbi:DUF262 domain-containing protein [Pseudoflavonifractor sp. 524-17]|uniref:DUF262 domain-containing protein n=1 Tax=Pseudoflavonifractor sp. 524-17 TaxID=2304577 RepID=UPI00137B820D|nr:DUF262 domain-containing protein [Pseudoflavonifractor sp. 524-17]NCE65567.1 DUF262 domain-containing protein [Pseudoflavonifractor sp. 524-17]
MQRFNINWTAKALVNQMEKGKVNYDNAVQRNLVWDADKKSLLIHSMIYGYAIPAMYFTREENGVYDSLDGKQRSNTISEFLHDEFALSTDTPAVVDDNGCVEDVSGLYFSQLPEWARDRIKDYNLTIYYYEGMTETEIREFFRRLNNGKPLSSIELTRANVPSLSIFQQLAKHKAIQFVVSDAGRKRFTDEMIAMQLYQLITEESPDFSTKPFREWASKVEVDSEVLDTISSGLDAYSVFARSLIDVNNKVLRTVKGRTHFISCVYYCCLAVENDVNQDEINRTLAEFFSGHPSTSPEYNHTVSAGSAKPTSVQTRRDVMRSLLPSADEMDEPDLEDVGFDNMDDPEQFEEEDYES